MNEHDKLQHERVHDPIPGYIIKTTGVKNYNVAIRQI